MTENIDKIGDYYIKADQILGSGSFGKAFKCYKNDDKSVEYCIKIINKTVFSDPKKEKSFQRSINAEIEAFKKLKNDDCENLVRMIEIFDSAKHLCIIMELCEYDLHKELVELRRQGKWLSQAEMVDMIQQILQGANVLIRNHIIHRDIKPQNILVKVINKGQKNQKKIYKIADFGFTRYLEDIYVKANFTRVGTKLYCAPEILKMQKFSCLCDVYSYGIVFYQILFQLKFPRDYKGEVEIYNFIDEIQKNPFKCEKIDGIYGEMIGDLIEKMLIFEQDNRISFEKLENHEIMRIPKPILGDSIYLPIQRDYNSYKEQKNFDNEQDKFDRLNLMIDIFYRKFLLCKSFVNFMKQNRHLVDIEQLVLQQLISIIGFEQINYGFALINCIISDFEPSIQNNNDIPLLIELLNRYLEKSKEIEKYNVLHNKLLDDYYSFQKQHQNDFNYLLCEKVNQKWTLNQDEFKLLQQARAKRIPIERCCIMLQKLTNQYKFNDWVSKCDLNAQENLNKIKNLDQLFQVANYRLIRPNDIYKIQ